MEHTASSFIFHLIVLVLIVGRRNTMKMDRLWINSFREKLDQHYAWPSLYTFKFIVPTGKEHEVKNLFPRHETSDRLSKQGNYTSITVQMMMPSGDAVIEIYEKAAEIEGILAL